MYCILFSTFQLLLEEKENLLVIRRVNSDKKISDRLDLLLKHNDACLHNIETFCKKHIPQTIQEFLNLGKDNISAWFDLFVKYPSFRYDKEKELIILFWLIFINKNEILLEYKKQIKAICVSDEMVWYITHLLPGNESLVGALYSVVDSCTTMLERERFYLNIKVTTDGLY